MTLRTHHWGTWTRTLLLSVCHVCLSVCHVCLSVCHVSRMWFGTDLTRQGPCWYMRKKYPLGRSDSVGNKEALETGDCVWIELHHSSPKEPSHHHHSQPRRSPLSAAEITTLSRGDHHSQPPRSLEYIGSLLPFHLTDVRFYHSVTHWRLVRPNSRPHLLLFSDLCWWLS